MIELNSDELRNTDGGHPVLVVIAAVVVIRGALIVGAAVGYALYKLVDWATSKKNYGRV